MENRVAQHWSSCSGEAFAGSYWSSIPAVQRRLNRKASSSESASWIDYCLDRYLAGQLPLDRVLSLGCGWGWLERTLATRRAFRECTALDIAPGAIDTARQIAQEEGIEHIDYQVANLDTIDLPAVHYDAIWVHHAYHHIANLEHVTQQVRSALRPGGFFFLNEYIGPARFQFPEVQRQAIRSALQLLPARYRQLSHYAQQCAREQTTRLVRDTGWALARLQDKLRGGDLLPALRRKLRYVFHKHTQHRSTGSAARKDEVVFPTTWDVTAVDPSEAVRSHEIVPVLQSRFDVVEMKPLGGNLLHFLLDGLAHNFPDDDPAAQSWLAVLFALEDALLTEGEVGSDFALLVARRREP